MDYLAPPPASQSITEVAAEAFTTPERSIGAKRAKALKTQDSETACEKIANAEGVAEKNKLLAEQNQLAKQEIEMKLFMMGPQSVESQAYFRRKREELANQ
uniref:No apical meristem-associated C-terminal domain-containing protein n=1 Tax=Spongospora subterranea TaxID=70186 RepID=A0A0H5R4A7_9EUKA|eukprot:CRZ02859.1 hypothetical protein [Spongospora subterranea]